MFYWLRACIKFGWPLTIALVFMSLGLVAFWFLAAEVVQQQAFPFDAAVLNWLNAIASPGLTAVMLAITTAGSVWFVVLVAGLLALLWYRRHRADLTAIVVSATAGAALNELLKAIFARPRPTLHPALTTAAGWSFPSGHSTTALAFYGMLAYLLAQRLPRGRRWLIYLPGAVFVVLVGLSRNYLGVHYPSDVLAAYAVTSPIVVAIIYAHRCAVGKPPEMVVEGAVAEAQEGN